MGCFILTRESMEKGLRKAPLPGVPLPDGPLGQEGAYRLIHALYRHCDEACKRVFADFSISEEEITDHYKRCFEGVENTNISKMLRSYHRGLAIEQILSERVGSWFDALDVLQKTMGWNMTRKKTPCLPSFWRGFCTSTCTGGRAAPMGTIWQNAQRNAASSPGAILFASTLFISRIILIRIRARRVS